MSNNLDRQQTYGPALLRQVRVWVRVWVRASKCAHLRVRVRVRAHLRVRVYVCTCVRVRVPMDGAARAADLGRAGVALAALKLYRSGLLLSADLADAQAAQALAQHGESDPVVSVLRHVSCSNRAARQSLDECAAAVDAHFSAQLHAAALHVVGATASCAQTTRHFNDFARTFALAAQNQTPLPLPQLSAAAATAGTTTDVARARGTCAAVQLLQFWRTCLVYTKLACWKR